MPQVTSIRSNGTKRVQEMNTEPTCTQQNAADECDVNKIIAKYKTTGVLTHLARSDGSYIDVSSIPDYHTALQSVLDAQTAFNTLSAQVRLRFNNDPGEMLQFLANPANLTEAISLGLADAPKAPAAPQQPSAAPNAPTAPQQPASNPQASQAPTNLGT